MITWSLKSGYVENEDGETVAIFPDSISETDRDLIWRSPEMHEAIRLFVEEVERGVFKRKQAYDRFKSVLSKITQDGTRVG